MMANEKSIIENILIEVGLESLDLGEVEKHESKVETS